MQTHSTSGGRRQRETADLGRKATWGLASQIASSASNSLLIIAVSKSGTAADVGTVGLAALLYQVGTGLQRSLHGEIVLITDSTRLSALGRAARRSVVGFGLLMSCVLFATSALVASAREELIILGLFVPLLFAQDLLRYQNFALGRTRIAALGDLIWAIAFGSYFVVALAANSATPTSLLAAWCLAGVISFAALTKATELDGATSRGWLRETWAQSRYFLPDYVAASAVALGPSLFIASYASFTELGSMRLAATYLGPIAILWAAIANTTTPVLVAGRSQTLRVERWATALILIAIVAWAGLGLLIPTGTGETLLGEAWPAARTWLPWIALAYLGASTYGGGVVALRVSGAAQRLAVVRLSLAPLAVSLPCIGFAVRGPAGYGVASLVAGTFTAALIWPAARRAKHRWAVLAHE